MKLHESVYYIVMIAIKIHKTMRENNTELKLKWVRVRQLQENESSLYTNRPNYLSGKW